MLLFLPVCVRMNLDTSVVFVEETDPANIQLKLEKIVFKYYFYAQWNVYDYRF